MLARPVARAAGPAATASARQAQSTARFVGSAVRCSSTAAGASPNSATTAPVAGTDSRSRQAATPSAPEVSTAASIIAARAAGTASPVLPRAPLSVWYPATCSAAGPSPSQRRCAAPRPNRLIAYVRAANACSAGRGSGERARPCAITQPVPATISPQRTVTAAVDRQPPGTDGPGATGRGRGGAGISGNRGSLRGCSSPGPAVGAPAAGRCSSGPPCSIRPPGRAGRRSRWRTAGRSAAAR